MVQKSNQEWQPLQTFQWYHYTRPLPHPHVQDFNHLLAGKKIFSTLDLKWVYHQIPVYTDDIQKRAIKTPFGLFVFTRTPFGLKIAAEIFQRFMNEVFNGLEFCFVYIDDILVDSESLEEHERRLNQVF